MKQWLTELIGSWTWQDVLITIVIFAITFAASLAIVSLILVKLPPDYFRTSYERKFLDDRQRWIRVVALVAKNVLGLILVLLGIILSIPGVPGQGLLTILLGVMLLDFPGKHRLEQRIVSQPKVKDAINGLRHRFGKPPLTLD